MHCLAWYSLGCRSRRKKLSQHRKEVLAAYNASLGHSTATGKMGLEAKIGVPPNHPFVHRVFHEINHPFWDTPIFGLTDWMTLRDALAQKRQMDPRLVYYDIMRYHDRRI